MKYKYQIHEWSIQISSGFLIDLFEEFFGDNLMICRDITKTSYRFKNSVRTTFIGVEVITHDGVWISVLIFLLLLYLCWFSSVYFLCLKFCTFLSCSIIFLENNTVLCCWSSNFHHIIPQFTRMICFYNSLNFLQNIILVFLPPYSCVIEVVSVDDFLVSFHHSRLIFILTSLLFVTDVIPS